MPIEVESPEELGYDTIANNLAESSFSDLRLADFGIDADVSQILLQYGDDAEVRQAKVAERALRQVVLDRVVAELLGGLDLDRHPPVAHLSSRR